MMSCLAEIVSLSLTLSLHIVTRRQFNQSNNRNVRNRYTILDPEKQNNELSQGIRKSLNTIRAPIII